MKLTSNDLRVLSEVSDACETFDCYIPHGAADWKGVLRLQQAELIELGPFAGCEACGEEGKTHETFGFLLTAKGEKTLRGTP